MSSDPEQEFFSDGISEELLNVLAQLPELRVASRTSAFAFKGTAVGIDSIARALNVRHVLEGSVRKAGDRVRITAQLIDAATGYHLWSESYDRELTDIFAVQERPRQGGPRLRALGSREHLDGALDYGGDVPGDAVGGPGGAEGVGACLPVLRECLQARGEGFGN